MSKYTLRIEGRPIDDAQRLLAGADGINAHDASLAGEGFSVTVDAPSLDQAEKLVRDALPAHGTYSVARPDPAEDEDD